MDVFGTSYESFMLHHNHLKKYHALSVPVQTLFDVKIWNKIQENLFSDLSRWCVAALGG